MKLTDLKGKKITVMGLGLHGDAIGAVRFLSDAGAVITVTDIKSKEELSASVEKIKGIKNVSLVLNQHRPEDFTNADMILKNPGASWSNKYIKMAQDNGIPVEIDSSLFFKLCKNKIVGVTGTKGKTTTSTLIYEIMKASGRDVVKAGIGQISVLDKLKDLKKDTLVVFELSSWRLSALGKYGLSPQVAVITNIYQDHLNYYKTMDEYVADKKFIFQFQKKDDICIINNDNEIVRKFEPEIKSKILRFSSSRIGESPSVFSDDGNIYVNDGIDEKKAMSLEDIKLKGAHNVENVLAAVATAFALNVDLKTIQKAISNSNGVANHRLELVRELRGTKYYNDTAATTPESAISGLNSFSEPVILICGGSDKNLEVKEFARVIAKKAKGVIFLKGAATEKMIESLHKSSLSENTEFKIVDSMEKAVELASGEAQSGDVVLLSPGAASFGLFANEFERGDKFKEAVKALE